MGCVASFGKYAPSPEGLIPPDLPKEDRLGSYQLESPFSRSVESSSKREDAIKVGEVTRAIGDGNVYPVVHVLELVMKSHDNEWLLRGRIDLQDFSGPSGWITIAKFNKMNGKLKDRLAKPCLEDEPGKELHDDARTLVERRRKLRKERAARRAAGGPAEDTTIVLYDSTGPYIFCGEYDGKGDCEWLGQHRINIGSIAKGSRDIVAFNHGNESIICIYDRAGKKCIFGKYNSEGGCKWFKEHFISLGSECSGNDNIVAFNHNGSAIVCIHRGQKLFFGKYNGQGGCKWYGEHIAHVGRVGTGSPDHITVFNHGWDAIICIYRPQETACYFGNYTGQGSCDWYAQHCVGNFSVTQECTNIVACNHKGSGIICINRGQQFFFGIYNGQGGCDWYREHYADMGSVADSCDRLVAFNHADDAHVCLYDPRKRKCFFGKYNGQGACRWHNQHNTDTGGIDYRGIVAFTR
mmetsp:Transcript_7555/g.13696  ORF Transcript_7555/g.13696 Transcript_7555/m.13696 type:complete len:465 (-) Transcript_7555:80-1474(-)